MRNLIMAASLLPAEVEHLRTGTFADVLQWESKSPQKTGADGV